MNRGARTPAWASRPRATSVWASIPPALFEIGYIVFRASRGEASHFNQSSVMAIVMYGFMGVGALALSSTALVQGLAVLRTPNTVGDNPVFRAALGWGLVLTFVLGASLGVGLRHRYRLPEHPAVRRRDDEQARGRRPLEQ